jgi:adenosine deaminase
VDADPEVAAFFEACRDDQAMLTAFLHRMPKGANLHQHVSGGVYPEAAVDRAIELGLWWDRRSKSFVEEKPESRFYSADDLRFDYGKYSEVLDGLSMRNRGHSRETDNVLFFGAFGRVGAAGVGREEAVRHAVRRAVAERVSHLELMTVPVSLPDGTVDQEGTRALLESLNAAVRDALAGEADGGAPPEADVLWTLQLSRDSFPVKDGKPDVDGYGDWWRRQVSTALDAADALAPIGAASVTVAGAEDAWISRSRFEQQFRTLDEEWQAFRGRRPDSQLRLNPHGGALTLEYSPDYDLRGRVRRTVEGGHASRLGHGAAVAWDDDAYGLLRGMRERRVAVEISLAGSRASTGAAPEGHPFRLYRRAGVPVVLSAGGEGVSRSNLTMEFVLAAQWFGLGYADLKELAYASLEHSFLPGESLFAGGDYRRPRSPAPEGSRKALLQQRLVDDFEAFEEAMKENMSLFR